MYIKNTLNYITPTESGHIILNQTKPQNIYYIHMKTKTKWSMCVHVYQKSQRQ